MSPATFRISLSDAEFSMVRNTEAAVTDKLNDKPRHFLLGSTDPVLEILSRYKKGELLDAKIWEELFNVIGERKRSLDIYTTQKLQKKVFYSDSDYLLSHLEQSHREQLFTVFYTRRKVSLDQKIPVEIRIDRIIRNLREQGDGLKRIFKKKESLLGRRSLHMDVSVYLETFSSTDRGLIRDIPPMPDIAESVNVYKLEIEMELSLWCCPLKNRTT